MGNSRFDADDWKGYTRSAGYQTKSANQIFTKSDIDKDLDPKNIKIRECRDSPANPNSNAIMILADETGSMGYLAREIINDGIPTLVKEIYDRKPIVDPNILVGGIGDDKVDTSPLQVSQFEADSVTLIKQIEKIYLEGNGGGNDQEGYSLAYFFAANFTAIDCFEKRGKKGYLFTLGDEPPNRDLRKSDLARIFGREVVEKDLSMNEVLSLASRKWEIFHIVIDHGQDADRVHKLWKEYLGERAIRLKDHTKLGEVITSIIQVKEGQSQASVVKSWDGSTAMVVRDAIKDLTPGIANTNTNSTGVVTL